MGKLTKASVTRMLRADSKMSKVYMFDMDDVTVQFCEEDRDAICGTTWGKRDGYLVGKVSGRLRLMHRVVVERSVGRSLSRGSITSTATKPTTAPAICAR